MALIIVILGDKVDPVMADLLMAAITGYMMWSDAHKSDDLR